MRLFDRLASLRAAPATGHAHTALKVLNFVGTVRGAVTTVLLTVSAIGGGAATVQAVRHETAERTAAPTATATRTIAPTPTRQTAASIFSDIKTRLDATLANDAQAAEDLRKVAVFSGPRLDQLVAETRQKLQDRYDTGIAQLQTLLGLSSASPSAPAPSGTSAASPSPASIITANALATVITTDLNTIVVLATRAATEPTPVPRPATTAPVTPAPTVRTLPPTPVPTPSRSPSPSPRKT